MSGVRNEGRKITKIKRLEDRIKGAGGSLASSIKKGRKKETIGRSEAVPKKKVTTQMGIKRLLELKGPEMLAGSTSKTRPQIGAVGALGRPRPEIVTPTVTRTVPSESEREEAGKNGKGRASRPLERWLQLGKGPLRDTDRVKEPVGE